MTTTLNNHLDGPHAFSDAGSVAQWNATQWLIEYVEDNNENNGGKWSDWTNADEIRTTYEIEDDQGPTGNYHDIGPVGTSILNAAIHGLDYEILMNDWQSAIANNSKE